jgi:hypothetical protein
MSTSIPNKMDKLVEISAYSMGVQLSQAHRRVFKNFLEHAEVSVILCFMSPLSSTPRLVPVGKGLEFSSVESAYTRYGETAANVFIVNCAPQIDIASASRPAQDSREMTVGDSATQKALAAEVAELKKELAAARKRIEDLKRLEELELILQNHEKNLNSREQSLLEMEDELMNRMHKHMEALAQMEQREDEVAEREASLRRVSFLHTVK